MKTWLWIAFGCLASTSTVAQPVNGPVGERLSAWLLRQSTPLEYPIGLQWQVPQERPEQLKLKRALLESLSTKPEAQALASWIDQQAVTGRVILQSADPRWLEANPAQDPVIGVDHKIVAVARPKVVTVLLADGSACQALHTSGATAKKYVEVCTPTQNNPRAWIAQPDGRVANFGIAAWNAQEQDELAPGAWVWAPDPKLEFSDAFSDGLIRFLASLGTAPDSNQITRIKAPIQTSDYLLRRPEYSANDWGEIGLIQTPSARMASVSAMRVNISKVLPYTRSNVMFQPTDWLEAGFRYTDIGNRLYDASGALNTGQTYKDKSFDFKIQLREESSFVPAIALGMRDIGGTGLFSSEYLVASKRFGDFDASLGMGWGYMASSGNISNPLGKLNSSFNTRPSTATVSGGEVGFKAMFRGPTGLFGGVQWRASDVLTYKVEREANNYQNEPQGNTLAHRSFWNFAANYRYSPSIDLAVGFERGNKLMIGVSFQTNLDGQNVPKVLNPSTPAFQTTPAVLPSAVRSADTFAQDLLSQTGWNLLGMEEARGVVMLRVEAGTGDGMQRRERMDRLNGLMQAYAGAQIRRWSVVFVEKGLTISALEVDRDAWIARHTQPLPASLKKDAVVAYQPSESQASNSPKLVDKGARAFSFGVGPSYSHILGGPDAFYLFRLGAAANASYQFNPSTWVQGVLDFRVLDNFDQFKYTAPSNLPRVRTFAREYATSSRTTIPLLQATHVAQPFESHFTSFYGGMLESMFAGVGGEWLYRPTQSAFAFGVDVNRVQQRDFNQNFALRDYKVNTGHATAYWDTGVSDILLKLQVGQYLAGDRGVTVDISRRFNNGILLGAFATKTNLSAAQFGEGSFDKGVYLSFPFDVMLPKYSDKSATIAWQPLSRDGGARLSRANPLYNLTSGRDLKAFHFESPPATSTQNARADEQTFAVPLKLSQELTAEPLTASVSRSIAYAGDQLTHPQSKEPWLWGAAAVLGAAVFDKRADNWAVSHSNSNGIAKVGNAIPLLLGVGALATSIDDGAGVVALKSGGIALIANTMLRAGIGRARPIDGQGSQSFAPFSANSLKSGFPSNHTAAAFALAAPLAQHYDAPWLYGLATITAIGRVQSRQHWLSDTVAGGVLGYAVGSVLTDEYRERGRGGNAKREFLASPSSLGVRWRW